MSFAIWKERPPFTFTEQDAERIYQVGAVWVVTDNPARATQAEVDAVLNPPHAASAPAMVARQRNAVLDALDGAIAKLPVDQREAFSLVQQLLRE